MIYLLYGLTVLCGLSVIYGLVDPEKTLDKAVKEPVKRTRETAIKLLLPPTVIFAFLSLWLTPSKNIGDKLQKSNPSSYGAMPTQEMASPGNRNPSSTIPWDYLYQGIEHAYKTKICAITRCGGFSFELFSEGVVSNNPARILKINYVEIAPGDHRTKHKRCSFALVSYDNDFKQMGDLFGSFAEVGKSDCGGNDQVYAHGGKVTFKQKMKSLGYSGKVPE